MAASATPEWETVVEETATKVIFDSFGDVFTGVKVNTEVIAQEDDDPFTQFQFRGFGVFPVATLWGINESYKLMGLAKVPNGNVVEITYIKDVAVGKGNDMKDYRVRTRALTAEEKKLYAEWL